MRPVRASERGSVLIIAVIAMLVMGVLSVSFALLASLETKIGVNYTHLLQARALAEGALVYGRDLVATAASEPEGFKKWFDGTLASHNLAGSSASDGRDLFPGEYWIRVDNDCSTIPDQAGAAALLVPASVQDTNCADSDRNDDDENQTAVLTAWAKVGSGQTVGWARVRAIVGVDDPWKHVCSSATVNSTCTDPINQSGNPTINPADTADPHGPKTYPTLPNPTLGCSAIDQTMHSPVVPCTSPGGRQVMVGVAGDPRNCNGGGQSYSGYFDCALTTPCFVALGCIPPTGVPETEGCVKTGDSRAGGATAPYYEEVDATTGQCKAGATGMVYNYLPGTGMGTPRPAGQNIDLVFDGDVGAPGDGRTVYAMRGTGAGKVEVKNTGAGTTDFYGTFVVEGDGPPEDCPGSGSDFAARAQTTINTASGTYGYPLVLLLYDPQQAVPTTTTRQQICADLGAGGGNTQVNGIVYSSGKVEFNPLTLNGGVVAYDVETQGSATYTYNETFGAAAPPPGFSPTAGASIAILRKSFITCTTVSSNASGHDFDFPSRCN